MTFRTQAVAAGLSLLLAAGAAWADPIALVKWKDVYDLLEATMDACEHAANVVEAIAIKNA